MIVALLLANAAPQAAVQARLAALDRAARTQESRLAAEQAPLARLLATAQRLALRPPALSLVRPATVDDVARTRALIAALAPEIRRRTAALRRAKITTAALRAEAEQALATLLENGADDPLAQPAEIRARLADLTLPSLSGSSGTPRGAYRLPASGRVVVGMGEQSGIGIRARGLTLATAPAAVVVAPAAGRITYSGPFRGYGDIAILDHGHGWTTILAGLELVTAGSGMVVPAGTPLGHMARRAPRLTIELRHQGRLVDPAAMMLQ